MKKNLMVIKLFDRTLLWTRDYVKHPTYWIVKNFKDVKDSGIPVYIEEESVVSNDAICVWFKILNGKDN